LPITNGGTHSWNRSILERPEAIIGGSRGVVIAPNIRIAADRAGRVADRNRPAEAACPKNWRTASSGQELAVLRCGSVTHHCLVSPSRIFSWLEPKDSSC